MSRTAADMRDRHAAGRRERRLIRDIVPPEGVPLTFRVAGLRVRLAAQLLDLLLTGLFAAALMILLSVTEALPWSALATIGSLLFLFVRAPYYIATELVWNGQTLGKRICAIRVVSANGRSLRPYSIAVRNVMKELEVFVPGTALFMAPALGAPGAVLLLVWIAVLLAVPLTNARRQRLGDVIAGTYVIHQPRAVLLPDLTERPAAERRFTFLAHQLDHYGAFELQTLEKVLHTDTARYGRTMHQRHHRNLTDIAERIRTKIGHTERLDETDVPAFLEAFYRAQRSYLESRKLFGDARADKFHSRDKAEIPR